MSTFYKKGITALELLLSIAILVILILVALPQFSRLKEVQLLHAATSDVLSALARARSETLASLNSSEYGVHFQSDQVIIFKGTVYSSGASTNEAVGLSAPVSISNVTLGGVSGSSGNIYFSRIYGVPSATGSVTISSPSLSKVITISATGGASSN
jgi:Tfp pilus assembly protein FimT